MRIKPFFYNTLLIAGLFGIGLSVTADEPLKTCKHTRGFLATIIDDTISCFHYMTCPFCLLNPDRQEQKFYDALESNKPDEIEHLVYRRAHDPSQPVKNDLPLVIAAKKAHVEAVEKLIELEADVNYQPNDPNQQPLVNYPSPLIAVCAAEHLDPERVKKTVQVLLEHNADPTRACMYFTDSENKVVKKVEEALDKKNEVLAEELVRLLPLNKRTALDYAKKNNYVEALKLIRTALATYKKKES